MKKYIALVFAGLIFCPVLQIFGQAPTDNAVQSSASVSANTGIDSKKAKAEADKKAKKEAETKAALELKAKKDAEKKAANDARLKADADQKAREAAEKEASTLAKAKIAAEKKTKEAAEKEAKLKAQAELKAKNAVEKEAKLKAETDQKAKEAAEKEANLKVKAEQKAKAEADKKAKKEAETKAALELKAKKDAEKKAASDIRLKADADQKAREAAEKEASTLAKAKADADKNAKKEADAKAALELKAKKDAEKKAAAVVKAKAEAEEKSAAADELKAKEEISAKEAIASSAGSEAKRKKAEADKTITAAKKIASDKKASVEVKTKAQEEASAKEIQAKDAAVIALARENETTKARDEFEISRQGRIKARQQAAAAAKAKKEAAIEAKIKEQEKARAKEQGKKMDEGQTGAATGKNWWKRGFENAAKPGEAGKWKISAGVLLRTIHGQSFKTESYSQNYNIPAKAGDVFRRYEPAGDLNSYSDRNYEDGYVYKDDYTDLDGGTENYNGGQVQGDSIVFHFVGRTYTEYTRTKDVSAGETHNNSDKEIAPYIQLERVLYRTGWFDTGLHLDLSRSTFSDAAQYANFSDRQAWQNYAQYVEDVYSLAGAPVIDNVPDARRAAGTVETGSYSYNAINNIQQSLDMNLGTMSLGALMSANWWRLSLSGIAGPTFNLVNIQTDYTETLYASVNNGTPEALQTWNDSQDYSECKFGGFVQAQLGLRIIDGVGVGIFGRYDWLENMSGNVGQSRYMINPEGGSLGATANLSF